MVALAMPVDQPAAADSPGVAAFAEAASGAGPEVVSAAAIMEAAVITMEADTSPGRAFILDLAAIRIMPPQRQQPQYQPPRTQPQSSNEGNQEQNFYLIAFSDHTIRAATAYKVEGDELYWIDRDNKE